ncbi:hypothetical protein CEP88_10290 [Roseobacter denitrificans]|uniref:IraD/Gp25-like domain-containing protein n=1 Tax=Roseobacter denitrificans (strain ATCC 33942 / OCh 114) TaxID=375451 RepID=Q160D2_ROSDO|nr:GPW/gp25 family protein [Roseobacter denitrificans]ABG33661.1 conserved hypothetical protein [Roseobacter denitrificans OCh 114]AVL52951.1 hypothetical protein CEP88_10290 [Roseobacter denitrificans]SFG03009.1 hypothetical protein SAMN05443635_10616 [Roseobacter denitrificans OCh 114]
MSENDPGFLGRGWHFPPTFDKATGEVEMVQAEPDIEESLCILMATRPGERIMQPAYGCRLHDYVFETNDGETEAAIETAIRQAILFFEPRITLHEVSVDTTDWLGGKMRVSLDYTVDQTNSRSNMVYPFYVHEGTLVADTPMLAI